MKQLIGRPNPEKRHGIEDELNRRLHPRSSSRDRALIRDAALRSNTFIFARTYELRRIPRPRRRRGMRARCATSRRTPSRRRLDAAMTVLGKRHDHECHERCERLSREPGPNHLAGPRIAVHLGQHVAEECGDRERTTLRPPNVSGPIFRHLPRSGSGWRTAAPVTKRRHHEVSTGSGGAAWVTKPPDRPPDRGQPIQPDQHHDRPQRAPDPLSARCSSRIATAAFGSTPAPVRRGDPSNERVQSCSGPRSHDAGTERPRFRLSIRPSER